MGPGIPISAPAESAPDDPSLGETPNKACNNNQLQDNSLQPVQGWSGNRPTASHRPCPNARDSTPRSISEPGTGIPDGLGGQKEKLRGKCA
jgi:hypothetical protein